MICNSRQVPKIAHPARIHEPSVKKRKDTGYGMGDRVGVRCLRRRSVGSREEKGMVETKNEDISGAPTASPVVEVATLAQLPPGSAMKVAVGHVDLTLVNDDGTVVAVGDLCLRCSHSLSTGTVHRGVLTCECCGWQYDLSHRHVLAVPELKIEMHDVRIEDDRLFLPSSIAAPAHAP